MNGSGSRRSRWILGLILSGGLFLNTYGMSFGLPSRWIVDETVAAALRVDAEQTLIWGDIRQTHFHTYMLAVALAPYAAYARATRPDIPALRQAAAVSWNELARVAPDFATGLYRIGRVLSALLGVATLLVVYRLGTLLFGLHAGLMAAALLALTQGFVGSNHLARSEPLVNFFGALVVYLLVRALDAGAARRRHFFAASFFAGLAFASKFNGLILVGSVGMAWLMLAWLDARRESRTVSIQGLLAAARWRWLVASAALWAAGVLVGQPTLIDFLLHYREVGAYWGLYFAQSSPAAGYLTHAVNYLLQLVVIFGVPFALFVAAGIGLFVADRGPAASRPGGWLVLTTLGAYFLVVCRYPFPVPMIKYIILDVPLLAVFGGLALATLAHATRLPAWLRVTVLIATMGYSAAYAMQVDRLVARTDPRYATTAWIETNVPAGASLEHFQEEAWLYSAPHILPAHPVIYIGRDSRTWRGSLFRQGEPRDFHQEKGDYLARMIAERPRGDFFLIWIEDLSELDPSRRPPNPELFARAIWMMLDERLGYRLAYAARAPNYWIPSSRFPGIFYPHSFVWDPVIDYTPQEIRIYRRVQPASGG